MAFDGSGYDRIDHYEIRFVYVDDGADRLEVVAPMFNAADKVLGHVGYDPHFNNGERKLIAEQQKVTDDIKEVGR